MIRLSSAHPYPNSSDLQQRQVGFISTWKAETPLDDSRLSLDALM